MNEKSAPSSNSASSASTNSPDTVQMHMKMIMVNVKRLKAKMEAEATRLKLQQQNYDRSVREYSAMEYAFNAMISAHNRLREQSPSENMPEVKDEKLPSCTSDNSWDEELINFINSTPNRSSLSVSSLQNGTPPAKKAKCTTEKVEISRQDSAAFREAWEERMVETQRINAQLELQASCMAKIQENISQINTTNPPVLAPIPSNVEHFRVPKKNYTKTGGNATPMGAPTVLTQHSPQVTHQQNSAEQKALEKCLLCKAQHATKNCTFYETVAERKNRIIEGNICCNCLKHKNSKMPCRQPKVVCEICGAQHHTAIHQ